MARHPSQMGARAAGGLIAVIALCGAAILYAQRRNSNEATATFMSHGERCKELAPDDPYTTPDSSRAYEICRSAADRKPNDAETQYHFALAAIQTDHIQEGVVALQKAAALGHCGANYFLGEHAWYGAQDVAAAESYYTLAKSCGDARAHKEVFGADLFARSAYPEYFTALYSSDLSTLNDREARFVTASYVAGFYEALSEQFLGADFNPCWISNYYRGGELLFALQSAEKGDAPNVVEGWLYEQSLPLVYRFIFPAQGGSALEDRRRALRNAGHADLIRTVRESECGALAPAKLIAGVTQFASARKSLREIVQEKAPQVHSLEEVAALLKGNPR